MTSASEPTATFNSRLVSNRSRDAQSKTAPRKLSAYTTAVVAKLRDLAPYAAIELLLPGGSLMALLLWVYRRHKRLPFFPTHRYSFMTSRSRGVFWGQNAD